MTAAIPAPPSPNVDSQSIPLQKGIVPTFARALQLNGGRVGINSVQIYNASSLFVYLYKGMSAAQGTPIMIPPWTNTTLLTNSLQFIYATTSGTPANANEMIDLLWTDQTLVAQSSPAGNPPGPASTNPWTFATDVMYTTPAQTVKLFHATINFNSGFFLTDLRLRGLTSQRISWAVGSDFFPSVEPNSLFGCGDEKLSPVTPIRLFNGEFSGSAEVDLTLNPDANSSGVSTPVTVYAGGYYV